MKTPSSLTLLTESLRRLPGIGPKTAQRMAFHLLQHDRDAAADETFAEWAHRADEEALT